MRATAKQVREILGIDGATLRKWVQRGHIRRYGRNSYEWDDVVARGLPLAAARPDPEDEAA
jgi:predicted site-specific integrase-resolvase